MYAVVLPFSGEWRHVFLAENAEMRKTGANPLKTLRNTGYKLCGRNVVFRILRLMMANVK